MAVFLLGGCYNVRRAIWYGAVGTSNRAEIRGTAGAGFAGVKLSDVLQLPVIRGDSSTADSVDLIENRRTAWRPALSTGLQFMVYSNTTSEAGGGLGVHMVFVPDAGGRTSPFPALTAHFGNRGNEVFLGALFMPSDRIRFPNNADTYRIAESPNNAYPDFVLENNRKWNWKQPTLYMGIQIGGVRLSERSAQEADEAAGRLGIVDIELDSATLGADSTVRVEVGGIEDLPARVVGANDRTVNTVVRWSSENTSVVQIIDNSSIRGMKADTAFISAASGGVSRRFKVVVSAKAAPPAELPPATSPPSTPTPD